MKIAIESTEKDDVPQRHSGARLERRQRARGELCLVFVANIGVENSADHSQFERELKETMPPTTVLMALSEVLDG